MKERKVLIVDDEFAIRDMLRMALEIADFECLEAEDIQGAHTLIVDERPDIVLLDWIMPEFDGFYALEKLQNSTTKIIVTTGLVEDSVLNQLNQFPILSIQNKPVKFDEVLKVMAPI